ncbi:hypothetical protein [Oxobacter pfennigii]|uniref:hypothetical protein n=1 Tax=Oxobacter pfennigii TaxID=36849 RepID=UPI001364B602|nr:hypothetical protein [Oxobacter pfennigii]
MRLWLFVRLPAAAALILTYRENGKQGMITLLKRGIDIKNVKLKGWYFITVLLMPLTSRTPWPGKDT